MRAFVFCFALCLLVGAGACWEDVECYSCDYTCEQTCEDACSWLQYNGYYSCSEDYWGDVSYVDCACYTSGWVWFLVSITCLAILIVACCLPPIGIIGYYWLTDPKKPVEAAAPGTYRLYSALNPCLYRGAVSWLTCISCMTCRPFLLLESARMALRRVDVRGTRLALDAQWSEYCKLVWFPTCIFNCFSCGLYACCGFAEKREDEFLDQRTSVEGQPGQPVVFFAAKADWWYRWIAALITAWTCGLAYSFFYVDLVAKSVGMMNLAGIGATSMLDARQFFTDVWLPNCIFDCFSCHLYSFCGFARQREAQYTDEHLTPSAAPTDQTTRMGNEQVYYGATPAGYSKPPQGPPPVPLGAPAQSFVGPNGAYVPGSNGAYVPAHAPPAYSAAPTAPAMDDYSYL